MTVLSYNLVEFSLIKIDTCLNSGLLELRQHIDLNDSNRSQRE